MSVYYQIHAPVGMAENTQPVAAMAQQSVHTATSPLALPLPRQRRTMQVICRSSPPWIQDTLNLPGTPLDG
eukprot:NODE_2662_length_759_cov_126.466197_g1867_i1.p2 GENE.NODE_2662_length_759_cov_126.466197_g1867_i1~~NODE_2662_length_759_cov_126.466197_g1867_i1.p2  ORF type:complete len:71 (+),score=0.36 NODE_2662_length_759_cov_126.466197_g1867_i1:157-369(+)